MSIYIIYQENSLTKVVDRFSQLSKDYVDLQCKYEKMKEELIQRESGGGHSMDLQSKVCIRLSMMCWAWHPQK